LLERIAVDGVAIAEEIGRRGFVGEGIHELLGGPCGRGMLSHVEVHDASPMMSEHHEDEEHAQVGGGHGEEIDRDEITDMVGQERAPGLRGWKQPGEAPYATRLQAAVRANPTYSHHSANAQYKFNGVKSAK
jgi:hypothetical protein